MRNNAFIMLFWCGFALSNEISDYCIKKESVGNVYAERTSSVESGHTVSKKGRSYFYSAPDDKCKTSKFIIYKDRVDVYMEYNGFSYVMYFGKDDVTTEGWVKSTNLKKNGYGIGDGDNNNN